MDANLITALAGVLGSVSGASAAVATTWISQKSQTIRERAKWETRKRETLYGDFITEASRLIADAFDHSLDKPETLVKLYANLRRIRLVSSDAVLAAAEECCDRTEAKRNIRIYLDSGWPGDNHEPTRSMRDRLIWKGYRPGSDLFYLAFPEAKHDENAWAARSPIPFQFLFWKTAGIRTAGDARC
jgi:hypothetical protein